MTIVEKVIPFNAIGLHEGDTLVGLHLADGHLVLQVAAATDSVPAQEKVKGKSRFGDWGRKWAGTMELSPGETRESVRAEAMREKFGA